MAIPVNSIVRITAIDGGGPSYTPHSTDVFTFNALVGQPRFTEKQVAVVSRAGVDGSMLVETGTRGQPFSLVSQRYVANLTSYFTFLRNYQGMIGVDFGVAVTQSDLTYWPCDVLSVQVVGSAPPKRAWTNSTLTGYLSPSFELNCTWQLIARDP